MRNIISILFVVVTSVVIARFCFANEVIPHPKTVTVSALVNGSNDRKNGWENGVKVSLQPGVWQIKAIGGGWSCWGNDKYASPDVKGPWAWNVYIKRTDEERTFCYGECSDWWKFDSQKEASAYASQNIEPIAITVKKPGDLYFWIFDAGNINDNRGNVILEISRKE